MAHYREREDPLRDVQVPDTTNEVQQLQSLCHEYFVEQQQLRAAEDEMGELETTAAELRHFMLENAAQQRAIDAEIATTEQEIDDFINNPKVVEGRQLREAQRTLKDCEERIQVALDRKHVAEGKAQEQADIVATLELSLKDHSKRHASLIRARDEVHQEFSSKAAKCIVTQEQIKELKRKEELLRRETRDVQIKLRGEESYMRQALAAFHERDGEMLYLQKDRSFTKRALLGEEEASREQVVAIRQLKKENIKLREVKYVATRHLVKLRDNHEADAADLLAEEGRVTGLMERGVRQPAEHGYEMVGGIPVPVVKSGMLGAGAIDGRTKRAVPSQLEMLKRQNLGLLQQLVNTMQLIAEQ